MNVEKYRRGVMLHYQFTFGKLNDEMVGFQNILCTGYKCRVIESFYVEVGEDE
jgi:hypothetical protein